MKYYDSCFIGIPIPTIYYNKLTYISDITRNISDKISVVDFHTSHITLYYMGKQSEDILRHTKSIVKRHITLLRKNSLQATGMGYFNKRNPRVIYIDVLTQDMLHNFRQTISQRLTNLAPENNKKEFHPHITVGRIKGYEVQKEFKKNLDLLMDAYAKVYIDFIIEHVCIFGIDREAKVKQRKLSIIDVLITEKVG